MYILDLESHIIHDAGNPRYECHLNKLPKEQKKKIYTIDAVKRLFNENAKKPYNGCKYCMAEYHQFDMQAIFYKSDKND
ncbi:MAG: hypothetical protein OEM52_03545 [bacterium]|nr:hypothetical protein [bacterium]